MSGTQHLLKTPSVPVQAIQKHPLPLCKIYQRHPLSQRCRSGSQQNIPENQAST